MARVAVDDADPHLDRAKPAVGDVAEELLADRIGAGPAARGVGRQLLGAPAAEQPPHRLPERLAEDVPQRAVDAANRRDRDAAATEHREDAALAQRVVAARAAVEPFP